MNNQELKNLIIKFAKSLEVSELECIDNALCDAFKAQLNMQQPETILNHVHELEDKIKSLEEQLEAAQNKEPEVKEVIKEVEKEVIPTEVQDELASLQDKNEELNNQIQDLEDKVDDLNDQLREAESEVNDLSNALEDVLTANDTLEQRCNELHEQNEELLKALNEEEVEELTFEEPEEVSNEDILANNSDDEIDEEEVLKQMTESLDQLVIEDEKK